MSFFRHRCLSGEISEAAWFNELAATKRYLQD
jgi:hypothetical protein